MTIPLAVRLYPPDGERSITRELADVQLRSVAPGGFASASFTLARPVSSLDPSLQQFTPVVVTDGTGSTVWAGRLEDPGRTADESGQTWELTAIGPSAHAGDKTFPRIYVDRTLDAFERAWFVKPAWRTELDEVDGDDDSGGVRVHAPAGTNAAIFDSAGMVNRRIWRAGQTLGRVSGKFDAGVAITDWRIRLVSRVGSSTSTTVAEDFGGAGQNGATFVAYANGGGFATGENVFDVRLQRTGTAATPISGDGQWVLFYDMVWRGALVGKDGAALTGLYLTDYVLSSTVVADLLGFALPQYDGAGAAITGTAFEIDQLAYPDAVTAAQVLEDLMLIEGAYYWAAWEPNDAGKYRFEWVPWPTTPSYEATAADGFAAPATGAEIYNRARVAWRNRYNQPKTLERTSVVPSLDSRGLIRTAFIDLREEVGSLANAQRVGDRFLLEHKYPPNQGTLTVARPIYDVAAGRMVQPWEIRPGRLIRVRGVAAYPSPLSPDAPDGLTVFRVVAVDYDSSANRAQLTLDDYDRNTWRAIARDRAARARRS